jgi:hypothetical protein
MGKLIALLQCALCSMPEVVGNLWRLALGWERRHGWEKRRDHCFPWGFSAAARFLASRVVCHGVFPCSLCSLCGEPSPSLQDETRIVKIVVSDTSLSLRFVTAPLGLLRPIQSA